MQSIVFLPTNDLSSTSAFYQETLGFEVALDQGTCKIFRVSNGGFLGFCQSDQPVVPDQRVMLTIVDDDVAGWYRRLNSAGVGTDAAPRENSRYQIFHFFAADPSGYKLEFQRFLDPRWQP